MADDYKLPSAAMVHDMQLTPAELRLYQHHINNLLFTPLNNPDGSVSTIRNMNEGLYSPNTPTVFPSVYSGARLEPQQAMAKALSYGPGYWPTYPGQTFEQADKRYMKMHDYMDPDSQARFRGILGNILAATRPPEK